MRGAEALWNPEARGVMTLVFPLRPSVRPLWRPVATIATTPSRYLLMVVATFLKRIGIMGRWRPGM